MSRENKQTPRQDEDWGSVTVSIFQEIGLRHNDHVRLTVTEQSCSGNPLALAPDSSFFLHAPDTDVGEEVVVKIGLGTGLNNKIVPEADVPNEDEIKSFDDLSERYMSEKRKRDLFGDTQEQQKDDNRCVYDGHEHESSNKNSLLNGTL